MRTATVTKIKGLLIQTQQNTFVLFTLFKLTLDERKTLTKISTRKPLTTIPQTSACFEGTRKPANCRETGQKYHAQPSERKPVKSILHNWWRIWALGFHQETTEESRQQQDWFCIKLFIILYQTSFICLYGSRNVISTKHYFLMQGKQ